MKQVPFFDLSLNSAEIERYTSIIQDHMRSGQLILGDSISQAEKCFTERLGRPAKLVSSGTSACYLALKALNLPRGKKILTSPITWIATSNAIVENGLVPEFLPLDQRTLNIDVNELESRINDEVVGVSVVHHAGIPLDHKKISRICKKKGIKFVEDCAQAFDSTYRNVQVGRYSDIATFSFNPMKQLGCIIDLGLIVYPAELEKRILSLRHNGTPDKKIFDLTSLNFKPDAIAGSIIMQKLIDWDKSNRKHLEDIMFEYIKRLRNNSFISLPHEMANLENVRISPYTFPIILENTEICASCRYLQIRGRNKNWCTIHSELRLNESL